jgi:hypothetical protein
MTMNTPNTPNTPNTMLPDVPPISYNAIRQALKAHGVTLIELHCEGECRCEICGAQGSLEASLDYPLSKHWWECTKYHAEEDDEAHTRAAPSLATASRGDVG